MLREIVLYACAAMVMLPGMALIQERAAGDGRVPPHLLARRLWWPLPPVSAALVLIWTAMAVTQIVHPAVIGALQREPGGGWWRPVTALLVQSDGWVQLIFNMGALLVIAPMAERLLGSVRALSVYVVAGLAAQIVSALAWSPHGGGNSVAIVGMLGAAAVLYILRGPRQGLRRRLLLIPAAAVILLALTNNHGAGLAVGCLFGLLFAATRLPVPAQPLSGQDSERGLNSGIGRG